MMSSNQDRRADDRLAVKWEIPVQIAQWSVLRAMAQDVSLGGMAVEVPDSVTRGDRILFQFDGHQLEAEVCRLGAVHGDGQRSAGLRWVERTARRGDLLRRLIAAAAA